MELTQVLILLGAGMFAGFAAGLLGIGGGFFMTPIQYGVYIAMGLPPDIAVRMAFGTTMLVILPTAISAAWSHHRKGAVWWRASIIMGCVSLAGSFAGSYISAHIPGAYLKIAFGVLALGACLRMFTGALPGPETARRSNKWLWAACALPIGIVTGILGIGGGVMVVPVLTMALRFSMHEAVATSLGMMIFTAIGGGIGYIWNGLGVAGRPAWSLGYVDLISWAILTVSSISLAQVGAVVAHKVPGDKLRYIFAALLLYVGLRMVGLFEWLHWPI